MPVLDHVHTYQRISPKRPKHYQCAHPDCTSWATTAFLRGKRACCYYCGAEFILDKYALRLAKPKCKKCRGVPETKVEDINMDDIMSGGLL